jgi:hypothetical protein
MMIHVAQKSKNENEPPPLVMATTRDKTTKGWPTRPKEILYYRNNWTASEFTKIPYNWREQESKYNSLKKKFKIEKAVYEENRPDPGNQDDPNNQRSHPMHVPSQNQ